MIFEKEGKALQLEEFEKLVGAKWIQELRFERSEILDDLLKRGKKLYDKGELTIEQVWLGKYFQKEISLHPLPNVAIRYIDPQMGWGVFAMHDFRKMQFIAEYVGKVRKRKKEDEKNSYCFEYLIAPGFASPYTIDAREEGNVARYINHSEEPNLESALATFDNQSHIILFTKKPIAKGEQLCYNYGPDYWSKRLSPLPL